MCTAIPFAVSVVTVFTAGTLSLQLWWLQQANPWPAPADVIACRLMCGLVCVFLTLGGLIVIETVRRWYVMLANGTAAAADWKSASRHECGRGTVRSDDRALVAKLQLGNGRREFPTWSLGTRLAGTGLPPTGTRLTYPAFR